MIYKWIGAVFVVIACGGFGFSLAASHRREIQLLRQIRICLQFMECELKYHLTPLPDLCRQTAKETGGIIRTMLLSLAQELDQQTAPDVFFCMSETVRKYRDQLPGNVRKIFLRMGKSLGRFDLAGQLKGLESVCNICEEELALLNQNRDIRFRNYQTLGLCAGLALVILFV